MKKQQTNSNLHYSETLISTNLLRMFNILFMLICFAFVFINVASADFMMILVNGSIVVMCLVALIVIMVLKRPDVAIIIDSVTFSVIITSYIFTGGANGFSLIWMIVLPPMIMYALTIRSGTIVCGGILAVLLLFFWTPLYKYCYPFSETYFIRFPIVYFVSSAIAFLSKLTVIRAQEKRDELLVENIEYKEHLQVLVAEQAEKIQQQAKELSDVQYGIIVGIANIVESRDGSTGTHVKRAAEFVNVFVNAILEKGLYPDIVTADYATTLSQVAPMHDIGKIQVPNAILRKPDSLTAEEYEIMKTHTTEGGKLIMKTMGKLKNQDMVKRAYEVATYHHERWDGKGYPQGLQGEDIPLSARIMAVADVFEALTAERVYKPAIEPKKAVEMLKEISGTQLDPNLVAVFIEIKSESL